MFIKRRALNLFQIEIYVYAEELKLKKKAGVLFNYKRTLCKLILNANLERTRRILNVPDD